jgi:Uncharacterized conserved protein (DUF2293)
MHIAYADSFQGTKRIGNADDIPFPRKVQLAVLAHIRHNHTEYDALLKQKVHRNVARLRIEPKCLRILLKWRGDDDEYEIEERTEDVIVIDDSDDESSDELDAYNYDTNRSRASSEVKIVSWRQNGKEIRNADLPAEYFNPSFFAIQHPRPAQWRQLSQSPHRPPRSTARRAASQRKSTALAPGRSSILQSRRSGSRSNPVDLTEHQPVRHYHPVHSTQVLQHHSATFSQPEHHPPAVRYDVQVPLRYAAQTFKLRCNLTNSRSPAFPQPPAAEAPRLVYDKYGRPFYLEVCAVGVENRILVIDMCSPQTQLG